MTGERINRSKKGQGRFVVIPGSKGAPEELVREALTSPRALEELCDHYMPKIYNYVLKRVGRVPDAEDITSTVFEKALSNLESYDSDKASFSTWLYRIATNCLTDYYRSRSRRKEAPLEEGLTEGTGGSESLSRVELHLDLLELMEELPPKYREALGLRYFAGMRVLEVAETLDITESAASKRILRGLDELRRLAEQSRLSDMI